jgi:hypothetical protein
MTRSELIQNISDYISGSYGVPVKISEKEINHRINDALRWFYRYYDRAVTGKHYIIPASYFGTQEFKQSRIIKMPDCVISIPVCKVVTGATRLTFGAGDDISLSRMIASDVFLGSYSSDDLVNRVVYTSYYDLAKAFMEDWVNYKYNENTKELYIEGRNPDRDLYLRTYVQIDETSLFEDPLFIDYVRGACLESMGRMMSIITMNLPGGAVLNAGELKSQGKEMMKEVKEEVEKLQPSNYVEFYH